MSGSSPSEARELSVAVIIVTYHSAALTIEALRSIERERAASTFAIRAVVIDNASGDLPAIAQGLTDHDWSSWVSLVAAPRNGGFAYGNNLGIERACAQAVPSFLYFLNPDTQVRAGALSSLIHFLQSHPEAGIAGGSFEHPDGVAWKFAFRFPGALSELCDGLQLGVATRLLARWCVPMLMAQITRQVDWICGASMMVRPQVLAAIGGFDERYFLYFEETDFCLRARRAGFSTWYVPESRVMHIRGQSTGITAMNRKPSRLPGYWFESRRTYFATALGTGGAMLVDCVALVSHCLGWLKHWTQRRRHELTPHYIRDLWHHSLLRPGNRRRVAPVTRSRLLSDRSATPTRAA